MAMLTALSSCNTGIESTKTIKLSKNDRNQLLPTPEDHLAELIEPATLRDWLQGKKFVVADNRASLVFEPSAANNGSLSGRIISFGGIEERVDAGGESLAIVCFKDGNNILKYPTGKSVNGAMESIRSIDIPMIIDLDLVAQADSLLRGRTFWIKSQLWYDKQGNKLRGRKFVPVTVRSVVPGDMLFPLIVNFLDENGENAFVYMNVSSSSGIESRTFPSLFSLSDPIHKYNSISPEHWQLIQNGKVALGMTKDECRLALGNPSDVNAGHDWNNTIDLWSYKDGTFLHFEDGLLVNFRH